MTRVIAWHFTWETLRDGRPIPPVGEWLTHVAAVEMCVSGQRTSRRAIDALAYAPASLAHLVECEDIVEEAGDKLVCRRRRILASVDATETLWAFSRWAALSVIHLWDAPAPEVVRRYLETGDKSPRDAACAAAYAAAYAASRDASRDAACAAAYAASRDAACAAARDASRAAACAAARDASYAAARDIQNERLEAMLLVALGSKHPVLLREAKR